MAAFNTRCHCSPACRCIQNWDFPHTQTDAVGWVCYGTLGKPNSCFMASCNTVDIQDINLRNFIKISLWKPLMVNRSNWKKVTYEGSKIVELNNPAGNEYFKSWNRYLTLHNLKKVCNICSRVNFPKAGIACFMRSHDSKL